MNILRDEIEHNFELFRAAWPSEMEACRLSLLTHDSRYRATYVRLASLQAWRTSLLEDEMGVDSLSFFLEAQNDALVSFVLASLGSWRAALQSLRCGIENVLFALYYKDHSVELAQWEAGKHRLAFSALIGYLERHPLYLDLDPDISGIAVLKEEYSTLSKAVHASSRGFRMTTDNVETQLWNDDASRVGAWSTRARAVIGGLNLALLTMFRAKLQGAALPNLRKTIGFAIAPSHHREIRKALSVALYQP